jgi:hypothetical protein
MTADRPASTRPTDPLSDADLQLAILTQAAEPRELAGHRAAAARPEIMWEKWAIVAILIVVVLNGIFQFISLA